MRLRLTHTALRVFVHAQKKNDELTPLESSIKEQIRNGDASWLPNGRSSLLENEANSAETGMELIYTALQNIQDQQDQLKDDMRRLQAEMQSRC